MASPALRLVALTASALAAFAGNSLLCRAALATGHADPASFTAIRVASGALVLLVLTRRGPRVVAAPGVAARAVSLFAYGALFSWAYVRIGAGVGALVLFAFVQLTMVGRAVREGGGPRGLAWAGIALALGGLAWLVLPGAAAPDPLGAALMAAAGVAWGIYTLLGRGVASPLATTAAAFRWATPLALATIAVAIVGGAARVDARGAILAAASGAITSGVGYALWYAAVPRLGATRAAVLQLLVPPLAALGAVVLLGEAASPRLLASSAAILGGIAIVLRRR